jgi:hypothetical protein
VRIANESEQILISKVRKGDAAAMKVLYDRNVRYLSAVCSRYINDDNDLKDILQDSFVKIFTSLGGFAYRGPGSLCSWMKRIVVNEALMFLRNKRKINFTVYEANLPDIPEDEPEPGRIPADKLHEMIRGLPDGCRTVLNLYVFEEKSHKEIADKLGISESTSFSQYHRAKKLLAKQIKDYSNNEK